MAEFHLAAEFQGPAIVHAGSLSIVNRIEII